MKAVRIVTPHRALTQNDEADATTVGVACFAVAPPYRRHGLARRGDCGRS